MSMDPDSPTLGSDAAPPAGTELRIAGFRVVGVLGRGGMGVVYEAVEESLGRRVALKVLPGNITLAAKELERFRREAGMEGRLSHPGIIKVFQIGESYGNHYFAMELIEGPSLQAKLDALRAAASDPTTSLHLTRDHVEQVVGWTIAAAEALHVAHQAGIVHRDVKPANILLANDGRVVLTDFGLAREEVAHTLTMTGEFMGTPAYMSPEQVLSSRVPIDRRTDVYSLGVTLYECLVLRTPFAGDSLPEILNQISFKEAPPPRKLNHRIPKELETVVLRAIEKDPDRRYATMQDFAEDLQAWLAGEPIKARRPGLGRKMRTWVRRNPRIAASAAGTVALALVTALGLSVWLATGEFFQVTSAPDGSRPIVAFKGRPGWSLLGYPRWTRDTGLMFEDVLPTKRQALAEGIAGDDEAVLPLLTPLARARALDVLGRRGEAKSFLLSALRDTSARADLEAAVEFAIRFDDSAVLSRVEEQLASLDYRDDGFGRHAEFVTALGDKVEPFIKQKLGSAERRQSAEFLDVLPRTRLDALAEMLRPGTQEPLAARLDLRLALRHITPSVRTELVRGWIHSERENDAFLAFRSLAWCDAPRDVSDGIRLILTRPRSRFTAKGSILGSQTLGRMVAAGFRDQPLEGLPREMVWTILEQVSRSPEKHLDPHSSSGSELDERAVVELVELCDRSDCERLRPWLRDANPKMRILAAGALLDCSDDADAAAVLEAGKPVVWDWWTFPERWLLRSPRYAATTLRALAGSTSPPKYMEAEVAAAILENPQAERLLRTAAGTTNEWKEFWWNVRLRLGDRTTLDEDIKAWGKDWEGAAMVVEATRLNELLDPQHLPDLLSLDPLTARAVLVSLVRGQPTDRIVPLLGHPAPVVRKSAAAVLTARGWGPSNEEEHHSTLSADAFHRRRLALEARLWTKLDELTHRGIEAGLKMNRAGERAAARAELAWAVRFSSRRIDVSIALPDGATTSQMVAERFCPSALLHAAILEARSGRADTARGYITKFLGDDDRWVTALRRVPELDEVLADRRIAGQVRLAEHRVRVLPEPITPGDPWTAEGLRAHGFELPN